jgi:hypothetical protein
MIQTVLSPECKFQSVAATDLRCLLCDKKFYEYVLAPTHTFTAQEFLSHLKRSM